MHDQKYGDAEFERRTFPRFTIHLPFVYNKEDKQGEGITNNASCGGLQVYLADRVSPGEILRFKLSLPEGNSIQSIDASARVVWVSKSMLPPPKTYKAGVEFIEISDESLQFLKWFEQLWLNQGI